MCAVGSNPEEAIVRAVNDTLGNDTVAAIVRAAVGALHGRASLPRRSMDGLFGRTLLQPMKAGCSNCLRPPGTVG